MVTRQAVNEELRKTDFAVVGEGKGNGDELTPHSEAELSRMDTDHRIGAQNATNGDRDTDQEWPRDRPSLSKADPTDKLLELSKPVEKKEPEEAILP